MGHGVINHLIWLINGSLATQLLNATWYVHYPILHCSRKHHPDQKQLIFGKGIKNVPICIKQREHLPGSGILAVYQYIWGCRETVAGSDVSNMPVPGDGEEHGTGLRTTTKVHTVMHIL